jgi:hypothetical protein
MKKRKRKGLLLAPDDLEVGRFIAVHSTKGSDQPQPFFGLATEIKAINRPFVVVRSVANDEIATLDIRYLNIMPVTQEFVQAQAPHRTTTIQNGTPVNTESAGP